MVITECSSLATHWEQLSGYLGLSFELIDRIKGDHPNDKVGCWNEALKQWIKQNYKTQRFGEPSWKILLKAVARIDKLQCKKLAAEHQLEGKRDTLNLFHHIVNCDIQLLQSVFKLRKTLKGLKHQQELSANLKVSFNK